MQLAKYETSNLKLKTFGSLYYLGKRSGTSKAQMTPAKESSLLKVFCYSHYFFSLTLNEQLRDSVTLTHVLSHF